MITHFKLDISSGLIGVLFLIGLGESKCIPRHLDGIGDPLNEVMYSRDMIWNLANRVVWCAQILTSIDLEGRHTSRGIGSIIACKLSSSEVKILIILLVASESTEYVF